MIKWEYATATVSRRFSSDVNVVSELNDAGRSGWECFHIVVEGQTVTLYYKRPKE